MHIAGISAAGYAEFLEIVNAEIRPDRAKTTAQDDFPVILGPENRAWQLGATAEDGTLAGCIACLIRSVKTNWGEISVAGIGSVVTHPDFRGQGLSAALQIEMLTRLKGKNIPLAVLWTDQGEIYAGRGFVPAGWELHIELQDADLAGKVPAGATVRPFRSSDIQPMEDLYKTHARHTVRAAGDSARLYTMPGTRGWVLEGAGGDLLGGVFCGKGADFPEYVLEWNGSPEVVLPLLAAVRSMELAATVLVPCGAEDMAGLLFERGAAGFAVPSGSWVVLNADPLLDLAGQNGDPAPADPLDPVHWLGEVDKTGQILAGPLEVAIWGFDSV